ncbi:hypothetical protein FPV67DRAFT_1168402 [Lyophyllum atratum]|nr:hypothetical protein FPV67DRAFT_1168402 [Lyophyllum atratum]
MFTPRAHHDGAHDPQSPLTILGLVEVAIKEVWDEEIDIKFLLCDGEAYRKGGHANLSAGDLERAFIFLARAAMLALEKIPAHRDFTTYLSSSQRHNLKLHGKELLFYLEELRLVLVERYRAWSNAQKQNSSTQAMIPALASRQDGRADKTKQADQGDVVGGVHDLPSWAQLSPEDVLTRRQSLRTNRDTQATRGHSSPDDHGRRRGEGPRLGHEVLADATQLSTISSSGPLPQYFTPRPLGRAKARRVRNPPSIFTDPQEPPQGEPDAPLEVLSPLVFSPSIH